VDQKDLLVFVDRLFYGLMAIDLSVYLYHRAIGRGSTMGFHSKLLIGFVIEKMGAVHSLENE
jgi:hypothetical protein